MPSTLYNMFLVLSKIIMGYLTLTVPVMTIDALGHFETG